MSVPASSANVGSGFDAVAMAIAIPFVLSDEPGNTHGDDLLAVEDTHPAMVAHRHAGGEGPLWWRSPIPPGRGLGFSGAARVAGVVLALAGQRGSAVGDVDHDAVLSAATELEGHPENVAASLKGGVVVSVGGSTIRVATSLDAELVMWWPATTTSTKASRTTLPESVPFDDAVFNVGRAALLVAAFATGRLDAVARGTEDRLHTDARLAGSPASAEAMRIASEHCPLGCWLSGSGPAVATLCRPGTGDELVSALAPSGSARIVEIDASGAVIG